MFMSMKVPRGSLDEELAAISEEIAAVPSQVYLPRLFLKMGLETIRRIEGSLHLLIEPHVGVDLALKARAGARAAARSIATHADIIASIPSAISQNVEAAAQVSAVEESVSLNFPNCARFLQTEIPACDFADLIKKIHAACGSSTGITQENIKQALLSKNGLAQLVSLSRWVIEYEKIQNFRIYEVIAAYLDAYKEGVAFEIQARGGRFIK
jgi:hypothetical protein